MIMQKIMMVCEVIMYVALINMMILAGSLVGGVIFGTIPAFYAAFFIISEWLEERKSPSIRRYYLTYIQVFVPCQKRVLPFLIFIVVGTSNIIFWNQVNLERISYVLKFTWLFITLLVFSGVVLNIELIFKNKFTFKEQLRIFVYTISNLHLVFLLFLGMYIIYLGFLIIPGVFLFFILGLQALWIYYIGQLLKSRMLRQLN